MSKRIVNIRVMFVCFCGLLVGILFSLFNTYDKYVFWKTFLFFLGIFVISLALFLYGFFTKNKNAKSKSREKVSFLVITSAICFLIFTCLGFFITLKPNHDIVNLHSFSNSVRVEGVVCDYVADNTTYTKFMLKDCYIENNGEVIESKFKISVYADVYLNVSLGDTILIDECNLNKYSFSKSQEAIKLSQGIGYQTYINHSNASITSGESSLRDTIKNKTKEIIYKNLNEDNSNVMYAMLFGEKVSLSDDISDCFSYAGISHILAVSGLHVGIIATAILFILKKIRMNKFLRLIILSAILIFYAYICSFSPSVCRAGIMTFLLALCGAFGIEYDGLSSLSIAGIVILLFNPLGVLSLSFQLSFLSVFSIIAFTPTLIRLFSKIKMPKVLSSSLSISIATNIAILPVCANAFTTVSLLGILTNLIVLPLFTITFVFTFFIVTFCLLFGIGGSLLYFPNLFLHLIKVIANFSTSIDALVYKTFQNGYLILFFICLVILLLHYLMIRKYIKLSILLPIILISCLQFSYFNLEYSEKENTVVFTHQYDTNVFFYLKDEKVTMIGSDIEYNNLLYTLKSLRIRKIDYIVAYDLQLNDISNLKNIYNECNVDTIYIPNKFKYDEINNEFTSTEFFDECLIIKDMTINCENYNDQTIAIYLNILEIGDILIPELKPTKKEGLILQEKYKDLDYYYQPSLSANVDMEILNVENIITNKDENTIKLETIETIYIKEGN